MKKYGTISPVPTTDNLIYECFQCLTEGDQRKFVAKFKEQFSDVQQVNHTLQELILGAYVTREGFSPQFEPAIDKKTPDWLMTQNSTGKKLLLELVNFHLPDTLEREMWDAFKTGWMWAYFMEPNQEKMRKYKTLAGKNDLHYVVGVFGLFSSALTVDDVRECLEGEYALFPLYPEVTGVMFFQGTVRAYSFDYLPNPHATTKDITLSGGVMPVRYIEKPLG